MACCRTVLGHKPWSRFLPAQGPSREATGTSEGVVPTELPEVTHGSASAVTLRPSDLRISTDEAGILAYMGDLSSEGGWHAVARLSDMSSGLQFFRSLDGVTLRRPSGKALGDLSTLQSGHRLWLRVPAEPVLRWRATGRRRKGAASTMVTLPTSCGRRSFVSSSTRTCPVSAIALHIPTPRVTRTASCLSGLPSAVIHWCAWGVGLLPASG